MADLARFAGGTALLSVIILLAAPASGNTAKEILQRSKASKPPAEFLKLVEGISKTRFQISKRLASGWSAKTRCVPRSRRYCRFVAFCPGLVRSYHSSLQLFPRHTRRVTHLWAWVYKTPQHARLVEQAIQWYYHASNIKTVLLRKGALLLVIEARNSSYSMHFTDKDREQFQRILTTGLKDQQTRSCVFPKAPIDGRGHFTSAWTLRSSGGEVPSRPRKALLELSFPDERLSAVAIAHARGTADVVPRWRKTAKLLNARGMRLYKKKSYARASFAFELAVKLDKGYLLPIFNRACVAGLQGDVAAAIHWVWKLYNNCDDSSPCYWAGTVKASKKILGRVKRDKDLAAIRSSLEYRAFSRCLDVTNHGPLPMWP